MSIPDNGPPGLPITNADAKHRHPEARIADLESRVSTLEQEIAKLAPKPA